MVKKTLSNEIEYGLIFEDKDKQKEEITLELKEPILFISNVKHHIKLVQQKIENALNKNTMGMVDRKQIPTHFQQNDEAKEIIDKIFKEEFGAKLMEDKE